MNESLLDPTIHPDWLRPHSIEWYAQYADIRHTRRTRGFARHL